ncbi:MAG: hypothetical protein EBQ66_04445 [Flavobacteriia bacterium]|jgi:hypothetical protein|nr:hypothetical protein [Flavobacteriia bacterium]
MSEVEVYRISEFDKTKCYGFALKTRTEGKYPNEKYYSTNLVLYLGRHVKSERWGYGDSHGGAETFENNGIKHRIVYDYEGKTCFKVMYAEG